MTPALRVLIVEDNPADAELVVRTLRRAGFEPEWERVDTEAAYLDRLSPDLDIILSDHHLPQFDSGRALALLKERALDVPLIIVSGTIDEEAAVEAMKHGAADYLLKDRLARLGTAVSQAMERTRADEARRKATADTERSLALLETSFDTLAEGVVISDLEGNIFFWNWAALSMHGYASLDECRRRVPEFQDTFEFLGEDGAILPVAQWPMWRLLQGETVTGCEGLLRKKGAGGWEKWLSYSGALARDQNGLALLAVLSMEDITERKQSEQAVRTSQGMLELVLNNIPQGVFWKDLESRYLGCNAVVSSTYGLESTELIKGRSDRDFTSLAPEELEHFLRKDREVMASGESQLGIIEQATFVDGVKRWLETNKIPLHDAAGTVIGVLGTWQDITERRQSEEEIRRLADFPQVNPNPVLELTAEGAICYHNAAAATLAHELGFAHPREMLPPGTAGIVQESLARRQNRLRLETPFGQRIISWSFYPIPDRAIVHCYAGEVTEQRQLAEQFRQVQKMESVGQLAAGIAHDFNNVLTVIMGYSELLQMELADRPRAAECVEQIAIAGERAANLTRQLLLFSRKELAQRRLVDLNELTSNLTKMLVRVLGEDIALRLECRSGLPSVSVDPGMIEQVITNLSVNARDAMPHGGRLEIATSVVELEAARLLGNPEAQPGRFVCLAVSDTGCGIEPSILEKIFEPFFTTKEVGKGTGLGLATVYGIVMQHRGVIEVTSRPGEGTSFHLFLPAASSAEAAAAAAAERPRPQRGTETILVVEDEASMRPLLEMLLRQAGYTVLSADSGVTARRLWPEHREKIDLLLTDMVMPEGLSGKQLAASLQAEKPGLPVVFMSGYSAEFRGGAAAGLEEGLNYLQKPFTQAGLLAIVRRQLDSC